MISECIQSSNASSFSSCFSRISLSGSRRLPGVNYVGGRAYLIVAVQLAIAWPLEQLGIRERLLAEKDAAAPTLAEAMAAAEVFA